MMFFTKKAVQPSKINAFFMKKWISGVFTLDIFNIVYIIDQVFDEMTFFTEKRVQSNKIKALFTEK